MREILNKKILIIHDRFEFRGGAERLVLILAQALKADLMTEFWTEESFEAPEDFDIFYLFNKEEPQRIGNRQNLYILDKAEHLQIVWRYFRAHFNFLFKTRKIIRQYDTIIFSGNNCLTAALPALTKGGVGRSRSGQRGGRIRKILYCHSPVRHVFDLKEKCRSEQTKIWKRIIYYDIGSWGIRFIYWLGLKQMDKVVANSQNIKNRLKNFIHQRTDYVIYPPIDTDKFQWIGQEDYYLSFGRVERLKRIPDIVRAFQKMQNKKLIIVSGGPDLEKIKELAKGYDNIKILGWISDKELKEFIGRCIASIYIPIDEDFGMSPVESMSAGKPVIGVAEGGLKESIIDGQTGILLKPDFTIDSIVKAVELLTPEKALSMKQACITQAQKFSKERFIREMVGVIEN